MFEQHLHWGAISSDWWYAAFPKPVYAAVDAGVLEDVGGSTLLMIPRLGRLVDAWIYVHAHDGCTDV